MRYTRGGITPTETVTDNDKVNETESDNKFITCIENQNFDWSVVNTVVHNEVVQNEINEHLESK